MVGVALGEAEQRVEALDVRGQGQLRHSRRRASRAWVSVPGRRAPVASSVVAAEASEPVIAEAARAATQQHVAELWQRMRADGLLHPEADVDWIIGIVGPLAQADTYNLMVSTLGLDPDGYEQWLHGTWMRLATTPSTLAES
ncbi:hypothetical protein ACFV4K_25350 [Nocardia sp. NPDC059764]|uniref:hypothetical protein n=1 Tax=Nocardia sp. NPDC059764 TaxID=3346939 RepID=UPI00365A9CA6